MLSDRPPQAWQPIADLDNTWQLLADPELAALASAWKEQAERLRSQEKMTMFLQRLVREAAIETGIIERLYTLDRGVTQALIEQGLNESLIAHGTTNRSSGRVIALIRDQAETIDGLFDFVKNNRELSTSYIKELHQQITRHQESTDAITPDGLYFSIALLRGEWKREPNNPTRPDGSIHTYCPPIHVAAEMDRLIEMYRDQRNKNIPPEVEAAWLHHRFTQIHPFQDGNGRIARLLSSLIFIQSGLFPLVLTGNDRSAYIAALEDADYKDLNALVHMFTSKQKRAFLRAIGISEDIISQHRHTSEIIQSIASQRQNQRIAENDTHRQRVEQFSDVLVRTLEQRIDAVQRELRAALPDIETTKRVAKHGDPLAAQWNKYPIVQAAKTYEYYANTSAYSTWLWLRLTGLEHTEILFSFHIPGEVQRGIIVCIGIVYRRGKQREESAFFRDLEVLTEDPFSISYTDNIDTLPQRFEQWLESALIAALAYWERQGV